MPLVECIVDTDGTGDYSSLNAAEADNFGATSADLVANDEWVECECQCTSGSADTSSVIVDDFTTDVDCFVKIWCDPTNDPSFRHNGVWNSSSYRLDAGENAYHGALRLDSDYTVVNGLQIAHNDDLRDAINIYGVSCTIDCCIVKANDTSSDMTGIFVTESGTVIKNCVVYGWTSDGISLQEPGGDHYLYNNTIVDCDVGINNVYSTSSQIYKNNLCYGNTDDYVGDFSGDVTHNAYSEGTDPGMNGVDLSGYTSADIFNDYTNDDFSLVSGSPVIDAGTDLSSDMDSVDIAGTSRPQGDAWDIGAFEYVSEEGTTIEAYCTDGISISDASSRTATFSVSCSDGAAMGDGNSNLAQLIAQTSDGVVLSDNTIRSITMIAQAADGITASDQIQAIATLLGAVADGVKSSDSASAKAGFGAQISDGIKSSDSASRTATFRPQASDGIVFSDSVASTLSGVISAACTDGITLSDSGLASAVLQAESTDGVKLDDSVVSALKTIASTSDGIVFSDSTNFGAILQGLVSDGVSLSDTSSVQAQLQAYATDGIKLSETITAILKAVAAASDGVVFSDSTNWATIIQALANDGITLSDTASRTLRMFVQAADSVVLSDSGVVNATYTVECSDGVQFADSVAAIMKFVATVSDGVRFSDTVLEVSTLPNGTVRITFTTKEATLTFNVRQPGISFK